MATLGTSLGGTEERGEKGGREREGKIMK